MLVWWGIVILTCCRRELVQGDGRGLDVLFVLGVVFRHYRWCRCVFCHGYFRFGYLIHKNENDDRAEIRGLVIKLSDARYIQWLLFKPSSLRHRMRRPNGASRQLFSPQPYQNEAIQDHITQVDED